MAFVCIMSCPHHERGTAAATAFRTAVAKWSTGSDRSHQWVQSTPGCLWSAPLSLSASKTGMMGTLYCCRSGAATRLLRSRGNIRQGERRSEVRSG